MRYATERDDHEDGEVVTADDTRNCRYCRNIDMGVHLNPCKVYMVNNWRCSRTKGHRGRHVACATNDGGHDLRLEGV